MGLPSGTKWARYDIDVTQPDGFCLSEFQYEKSFFSWANVQGHNPINDSFVNIYNWGGVNGQEPWYEGQPYGDTPGSGLQVNISDELDYDAAAFILGGLWRIPSTEQLAELIQNVDFLNADGTIKDPSVADKRSVVNGILGIWMQSRINGEKLFIACSGYAAGSSWNNKGNTGDYWTSIYNNSKVAYNLLINAAGVNGSATSNRYAGFPIRPVQG